MSDDLRDAHEMLYERPQVSIGIALIAIARSLQEVNEELHTLNRHGMKVRDR